MTRLRISRMVVLALVLLSSSQARSESPATSPDAPTRAPAIPLITHNPYFSVWSTSDRPTDDFSRHWTGAVQAMCSLVRIDGKPFRLLSPKPDTVPPLKMTGLQITPTRTTYTMEGGGVKIFMTFLSPLLPFDDHILSRPVTYLSWNVQATDGEFHDVSLYFDASGEFAVNTPDQKVTWERDHAGRLDWARIGTSDQPVLAKAGDNLRIDWGYFYVAAPHSGGMTSVVASDILCREGFANSGKLPAEDDKKMPRPAREDWPVLAFAFDMGRVSNYPLSRHVLLAYDELSTVEYMGQKLDPYWRGEGWDISDLLRAAESDYGTLKVRCSEFDNELTADMERLGGKEYAHLGALAYRQCLSAHTIAKGPFGRPLMFSKENFSNGCIATVDVTYPSSPLFLLFNPSLLRGQLIPVLEYARSEHWKFPFAPHDLGTYPKANGQVYGGGEKTEKDQMPVEECGNMLIMVAALARAEGSADFAREYWPVLETWAKYLREKGLDPENQLCTDDFAGHMAHNTNLSLKAIEALGGFAQLCEMSGRKAEADDYRKAAQAMASRWPTMAEDGDHYRLAFDKAGTWSQKYNLVWDRLLGINLFPADIARREVAYYLSKQEQFGLPLDNRSKYTKLDWIVWTATLAESKKDFEAIIGPILKFAAASPSRVPLTDWYWTHDAKQVGFQARSVVGGIFIKMLDDKATWKKWSSKRS